MKIFYYIIVLFSCLFTATVYAKEKIMAEEKIDWNEYGRIEKGEIKIEVNLVQHWNSIPATLIFTNISKRELHLFAFHLERGYGVEVFLNNQNFEIKIDLIKNYGIPPNAIGKLTVQFADTPPVTITLHTKHRTRLGEFGNTVKKKDE